MSVRAPHATLNVIAAIAAATPAGAEPLFSISDETLVVRVAAGTTRDRDTSDLGGAVQVGAMLNHHVAAAELIVGTAGSAGSVSVQPSIGLKLKLWSTPENMGFTYVFGGLRTTRHDGVTYARPGLGVRDMITYDVVRPWAFALEWHAFVTSKLDVDGGVAIGFARAEERATNVAVLVGWKRERFEVAGGRASTDGTWLTVSHQWR